MVLPQETFDKQQDDVTEQPLQELPHGQLMSISETPVTSSDSDSELDFDGDFHDQEFWANLYEATSRLCVDALHQMPPIVLLECQMPKRKLARP